MGLGQQICYLNANYNLFFWIQFLKIIHTTITFIDFI